jgi:hypothetical protein
MVVPSFRKTHSGKLGALDSGRLSSSDDEGEVKVAKAAQAYTTAQ